MVMAVIKSGASDLHLAAGAPPVMRRNGELVPLGNQALTPQDTRDLVYGILTSDQRQRLENNLEIDFSYQVPGRARFRVNAYYQRAALGAAFRVVPTDLRSMEELKLPHSIRDWTTKPRGLALVTGPTGSGKSTTLAALIDEINSTRSCHIMTVEDPIEFLHRHKRSLVNQRELGGDTHSFANALRSALRQDPDVILVGEMRDLETIQIALTAAETGHLVFGTLHTSDAPQTVDRVIDVFPPHQQEQVRVMLANALVGVICQQLLPTVSGGRVGAFEVMMATPAVRNLIREGKTHQIYSMLQTGSQHGMQSMDACLSDLIRQGIISPHVALERAGSSAELKRLLESQGLTRPSTAKAA
ncbi:MAG: type IV pilus twitching motility protein PilT [Thermoleophilia bacterium]|nr:type IV pilus twitching motility protein PilT [Thermoleophilia bacterium]